jgi:hypothetical protein
VTREGREPFRPADPGFEPRVRASFARVEKGGQRVHCATGLQTMMAVAGRAGVKD